MSRMQLLEEWADDEFGAGAPSKATLYNYCKAKMIFPIPEKIGKRWMVEKGARFVGMIAEPTRYAGKNPLVLKVLNHGSQAENT